MFKHIVGLRAISALAVGALLAACSSGSSNTVRTSAIPPLPVHNTASFQATLLRSGTVFVSGSNVITEYSPGAVSPTLTIAQGFTAPGHLALDPAGNLYSGNGAPRDVTVYAAGSTSVLRTIFPRLNGPGWFLIGTDASARLYTLSYWSQCTRFSCSLNRLYAVYAPGATTPFRTLSFQPGSLNNAPPTALAFDRAENLYVGASGKVDVYAPGLLSRLREITLRNASVAALKLDSSGTLYVDHGNAVSEYAAGSTSLMRAIITGVFESETLAADRFNNLYVANGPPSGGTGSINVYRAGTSSLLRKIRTGIVNPIGLAFDASGNLYVLNRELGTSFNGSVAVYAPGGSAPMHTIPMRVCCPFEMAVRP